VVPRNNTIYEGTSFWPTAFSFCSNYPGETRETLLLHLKSNCCLGFFINVSGESRNSCQHHWFSSDFSRCLWFRLKITNRRAVFEFSWHFFRKSVKAKRCQIRWSSVLSFSRPIWTKIESCGLNQSRFGVRSRVNSSDFRWFSTKNRFFPNFFWLSCRVFVKIRDSSSIANEVKEFLAFLPSNLDKKWKLWTILKASQGSKPGVFQTFFYL